MAWRWTMPNGKRKINTKQSQSRDGRSWVARVLVSLLTVICMIALIAAWLTPDNNTVQKVTEQILTALVPLVTAVVGWYFCQHRQGR
jgi:hypothetical protein